MLSQSSIPEVKETTIGEALDERKAKVPQFQDLGPPDMITLVKFIAYSTSPSNIHTKSKGVDNPEFSITDFHSTDNLKGEIGTFFYTLGVDTSDPTSIAVFLKDIADIISDQPQPWFGKVKNYHVSRITLSTWNSFRKCDINVVVRFPGTLHTFILDYEGEQIKDFGEDSKTQFDLIWAETFISGVVRSLMLMKDNAEEGEAQPLVETLVLNPLTSGQINKTADSFIDLFPLVYENGVLLGSPCTVKIVTRTNNYLVETLIEIVRLTCNIQKCRIMLEKLSVTFPEVLIILAKVLFACNMEIDAFQLTNNILSSFEKLTIENKNENRSEILTVQAEYLLDFKHDYMLAKEIAQYSVDSSPSEFKPWYLLSKSYIRLNNIESALLTLNACPILPLKDKYILKRVVPIKSETNLHLPLPVDVKLEKVNSINPQDIQLEIKSADPALINLAATNLKSTFQLVYRLLSEVVMITGWESLLKYRSEVFVMEEENGVSDTNTVRILTTHLQRSTKRLCERWLDNLFMLLFKDLKIYTLWQTEQTYFDAQNSTYSRLTTEWEMFGLCACRLGHHPEAIRAFQIGLSQRFSPQSARKLLEYYIKESQKLKNHILQPNSDLKSSKVIESIEEIDNKIIDLCTQIACWNHRWYIEYSTKLIDSMTVAIQDMGISKVSNEIKSRYSESVNRFIKGNLLKVFADFTNDDYDK